ncbi:MAG TPA: FecR family protein [Methylomirabilota bacterium]|nr:FecR family protein [Methylomirabilota bacterium]
MSTSSLALVCALLATAVPSVTLAEPTRAGLVTTLEGTVTASSLAAAQSRPLKFRDDVFVNDRIVTGDRSIARMLLGGRAVVTVRERSALTITELPGKSTIALDSGKIAVAVAHERMKPGDEIEVRTPNAVAGVRGTVFVVEVVRSTAALEADATPTTWLYGFAGQVVVNADNRLYTVGANTIFSRIGNQLPVQGALTLDLRQRAEAGLRTRVPIVGGEGQQATNEAAMNATVAAFGGSMAAFGRETPRQVDFNQPLTAPVLPGGVSTIAAPVVSSPPVAPAPPPHEYCPPKTYSRWHYRVEERWRPAGSRPGQ